MQIRSHTHTQWSATGELVTSLKTANALAVKHPLFPLPISAYSLTAELSPPPAAPTSLSLLSSFRFNASLLGISNAAQEGVREREEKRVEQQELPLPLPLLSQRAVRSFSPFSRKECYAFVFGFCVALLVLPPLRKPPVAS